MAKTIVFNIPSAGHMNPSLPIVAELVKRGEDVVYANTEEYREKIEATGARFVAYPDAREMTRLIIDNAGDGNIPRNMRDLIRVIKEVTPFANELIADEKPDYVIFDTLARWGKLAAQKHNLPQISFCSTFVIAEGVVPPFPLADILKTAGQMIQVLPSYFVDAWTMRREQGIFPGFLVDAVMSTGELTLVFSSRQFQPNGEKFPDSYKFVGTSLMPRPQDSDFPFEQLTGAPLVYISLGTLANNPAFLRRCLEAFADFEGQFILSAGKKSDISALGTIPENFIVRNFVPQLEILERADAFITHGGLNSVQEGLVYGVPMLVVPQQIEQSLVAVQLEKLGAGIAIGTSAMREISTDALREGLKKLLSDERYSKHADTLGQTLKEAGGYQRAVDEILQFVGKRV